MTDWAPVAVRHEVADAPTVVDGASSQGFWREVIVEPANGLVIGMKQHTPAEWAPGQLEFTSTTTYHRTLVDEVPAEVRDNAVHYTCVIVTSNIIDCESEA